MAEAREMSGVAIRAGRAALPDVCLTVDANQGFTRNSLERDFPYASRRFGEEREFVRAFALCKWAVALANHERDQIMREQRDAIVQAARHFST
jgi:aspartate ammonia-lyase